MRLYKPWGEKCSEPNGELATKYRYTGQYEDGYINLYWYGSRWYDPALSRWAQPDSIVPLATQGTQALDRYAYTNNNPVRYSDPSGHDAWDAIGQFATGFFAELVLQNNCMGAYTAPAAAEALTVSSSESDAMLIGRITADLVTIGIGIAEMTAGLGTIGGGAVLSCVGTACVGAVATTAAGAAITGYGAATVYEGSTGIGENLGMLLSKRTSHADQRASQGRPVGSGWSDARKASQSSVYYDSETGNYIVTGSNGRAHVFTFENGQLKLHTSMTDVSKANVASRVQNGRWNPLTQDGYLQWLQYLNEVLGE